MSVKGKKLKIAQILRDRILSGGCPVGSKLESLAALAKQFDATVVTMSRALDILENEGLIERVNGLGIFVKEQVKHRFAVVFDSKSEMGFFAHKAVFMKHFIDYCHDSGFEYRMFEDIDTAGDCNRVRKYLRENSCDAVLISSRAFASGSAKYLRGIPVAAIGLYAYKDLETCIHSDTSWTHDAYQHLLKIGCGKIAAVTNRDQLHSWQMPEIVTQEEIYSGMCSARPDVFDSSLFCRAEITPRGGYAAACSFLDKIPPGEKIGIVVTDAILTHGVISAALQKQYHIGENLFVISHAMNGFSLSQFSVPVISYEVNIELEISTIDAMLRQYWISGKLEKGVKKICGKIVYPD